MSNSYHIWAREDDSMLFILDFGGLIGWNERFAFQIPDSTEMLVSSQDVDNLNQFLPFDTFDWIVFDTTTFAQIETVPCLPLSCLDDISFPSFAPITIVPTISDTGSYVSN